MYENIPDMQTLLINHGFDCTMSYSFTNEEEGVPSRDLETKLTTLLRGMKGDGKPREAAVRPVVEAFARLGTRFEIPDT
jgi:hypothetical protein